MQDLPYVPFVSTPGIYRWRVSSSSSSSGASFFRRIVMVALSLCFRPSIVPLLAEVKYLRSKSEKRFN